MAVRRIFVRAGLHVAFQRFVFLCHTQLVHDFRGFCSYFCVCPQESEYRGVLRRVEQFAEEEGRRPRILVRHLSTLLQSIMLRKLIRFGNNRNP